MEWWQLVLYAIAAAWISAWALWSIMAVGVMWRASERVEWLSQYVEWLERRAKYERLESYPTEGPDKSEARFFRRTH